MAKTYSKLLTNKSIQDFAVNANVGERKLDGEGLYLRKNKDSAVFEIRTKIECAEGLKKGWLTIGDIRYITIAEARSIASDKRKLMSRGIHPKRYTDINNRLGKTFGQILEIYKSKEKIRNRASSIRIFDSILSNVSQWENTAIEKINENDITELIMELKDKKPSISARLLQELKAIFNFAYKEKYLVNKKEILYDYTYKVNIRDRTLSEAELGKFFRKLWQDNEVSFIVKVAIYGLFILMLRREELLKLEWSDLDFDNNLIIVKQTKIISNFHIKIPQILADMLKKIKENSKSNFIFAGPKGRYTGDTICRYCKELSVKYGIREFKPHDARRTGQSILTSHNYRYEITDMALAHVLVGVRKHYLHTNLLKERYEMLTWYSELIDKLISRDN